MNSIIIAACQPIDIQEDIERSLKQIIDYSLESESQNARMICFPECFLQGYIVSERTHELAMNLTSIEFKQILEQLSHIKPILIIGLIERENNNTYNTAVVIKEGELLGSYRKFNLIGRENEVFKPGNTFPIFELDGIRFGINICNDLNFPDCAKAVSTQHADLLVCPCNNMLRLENAEKWRNRHNEIRGERCIETGLFLISSDVTGEHDGRISYGPTAIINNEGVVVMQLPLMQPGLLIYEFSKNKRGITNTCYGRVNVPQI